MRRLRGWEIREADKKAAPGAKTGGGNWKSEQ